MTGETNKKIPCSTYLIDRIPRIECECECVPGTNFHGNILCAQPLFRRIAISEFVV